MSSRSLARSPPHQNRAERTKDLCEEIATMSDAAMGLLIGLGIVLALLALYLLSCIRVLNEYERGVVFRLGRVLSEPKGPGLIMVFWPIDRMVSVDLRTVTRVVEPQDVIRSEEHTSELQSRGLI